MVLISDGDGGMSELREPQGRRLGQPWQGRPEPREGSGLPKVTQDTAAESSRAPSSRKAL